jgi:hypothetical protein
MVQGEKDFLQNFFNTSLLEDTLLTERPSSEKKEKMKASCIRFFPASLSDRQEFPRMSEVVPFLRK